MDWNRIYAKKVRLVALIVALGGFGFPDSAPAQPSDDITLTLESTTAQPGDTVELAVSLAIHGDGPESLIVFLAYDPAALTPNGDEYELILRNSVSGEPVLDGNGNTMAIRRAVRPEAGPTGAGKTIDSEVFQNEGVIGVSVTGLNRTAIPAGPLFTIALTAAGGLGNGTVTTVIGLGEDNAVVVPDGSGGVAPAATSASRSTGDGAGAEAVTFGFVDAEVTIGCTSPGTPAGVTASQNRSDGVSVGWQAVAAGAEYRVYRSTSNNAASAVALGAEWQSGTTFLDITALVPVVVMGDGCAVPNQVSAVRYFYWVRARTPEGCQGELSAPAAEGFRTQAKGALSPAGMFPAGGELLILLGALLILARGSGLSHRISKMRFRKL